MSWADDFYASTYATLTSNVNAGVNIFYSKDFLTRVNKNLQLRKLGQKVALPEGNGKTIEWFRYLNLDPSVSNATLTEGQLPSAMTFKGQKIQKVLAEMGAFVQVSSLLKQTHIDRNVEGVVGMVAEHAARVLDLKTHMELAAGLYSLPADYATDTESTFVGACDSGSTTTTIVDATLSTNTNYGDANDDLNQSVITFTSGVNKGKSRGCTDYVQSTGTVTFSPALEQACETGDTFVVATPDAITASEKLTYAVVKKGRTLLKKQETPMFERGYYVCVASPDALSGLMDDTNWINAHTYKDSLETGLFTGEVGKWAGVRFIEETGEFKFPLVARGTAGTGGGPGALGVNYAATGSVESAFMLGKQCFGVTGLSRKIGSVVVPNVIVKSADQLAQPIPRFGTVGWMVEEATQTLNSLFGVQIWLKAS